MPNRLKRYIQEAGLTEAGFGSLIGKPQQTVHAYASGTRIPRKAEMQRIYAVTAGAVQPNDFYDLPDLPTESAPAEEVAA